MSDLTPSDGIAVVTGAGSGLGQALAVELGQQGFVVAGLGRRAEALEQTRTLAPRGQFHPYVADVGVPREVEATFARLRTDHGAIALLINNAAVYPRRDFLDESGTSFAETMTANLGGVVSCTRAALEDMCRSGRGRILNVATFADLNPLPASSAYSVSKGAARILTRALIADLADRFPGIIISDWMPGMLRTSMGIPDGVAPETSARWGAALARQMDSSLMGSTFEMDREILPPRGLKGRIKDRLLLRKLVARQL